MYELISVIEQLPVQIVFHEAQDLLQQGIQRDLIRPHRRDGELGPFEKIAGVMEA